MKDNNGLAPRSKDSKSLVKDSRGSSLVPLKIPYKGRGYCVRNREIRYIDNNLTLIWKDKDGYFHKRKIFGAREKVFREREEYCLIFKDSIDPKELSPEQKIVVDYELTRKKSMDVAAWTLVFTAIISLLLPWGYLSIIPGFLLMLMMFNLFNNPLGKKLELGSSDQNYAESYDDAFCILRNLNKILEQSSNPSDITFRVKQKHESDDELNFWPWLKNFCQVLEIDENFSPELFPLLNENATIVYEKIKSQHDEGENKKRDERRASVALENELVAHRAELLRKNLEDDDAVTMRLIDSRLQADENFNR